MSDIWQSTAVSQAGLARKGPGAEAVNLRASVLEMTHSAEQAVLAPEDCGAWPADMRAALAARIARINGAEQVAASYAARMQGADYAWLTDPEADGQAQKLDRVLSFMDRVAQAPKDIAAEDIADLQASGLSDADIVRLCELNAFLAYQLRLVTGLQLISGRAS